MEGTELRGLILRKLEDGTLPSDRPDKSSTAYGRGDRCDACDEPIHPIQVEYEFDRPGHRYTLRLHLECAGLWEAFRLRRKGEL